MCRTQLTAAGDYALTATVTQVPTQPGHVRMRLSSTMSTARNPHEQRTVADLILSEDAARRLAGALVGECFA